jgi:cytochrome oxidase Cu insertion factor (SCO1/SenC/PrrC family)
MHPRTRRFGWLVWGGLVLLAATLVLAFLLAQLKTLGRPLPVIGRVADFAVTNQLGRPVSLADLRGQVWVADIIFTRCSGPCVAMTRRMKDLQQALPPASKARLVTLTTDPDFDTPTILKTYSERFNADPNRWWFVTGTKAQIARLAIDSLKLTVIEKKAEERENPQDLFIHSTIFVVVDKHGQLRGVFESVGDGIDEQKVKTEVLAAVRRLERE